MTQINHSRRFHLRGSVLWRDYPNLMGMFQSGDFYLHDGVISKTPKPGSYEEITGYAIPGLVDVHAHIGLAKEGAVGPEQQREQALADRDAGTLLIRDCGSPADTKWLDDEPGMPRILRCGRHLTRPKRYIRGYGLELENPADLPAEVVRQTAAGGGWVKLVGDWIDRADGADSDLRPVWQTDVLCDAVAAAHEAGARVTMHIFGSEAIDGALEAGVDCIEHGIGMRPDQIQEASRRGIAVTPTFLQLERFPDFAAQAGSKYPRYADTMMGLHEGRVEHQASLAAAGVQLLPGTDSGGYQHHGSLPTELARWTEMGMTPSQVLDLATWKARDFLRIESLWEGAPADLVLYADDPRIELDVLQHPAGVWVRGALVSGSLCQMS